MEPSHIHTWLVLPEKQSTDGIATSGMEIPIFLLRNHDFWLWNGSILVATNQGPSTVSNQPNHHSALVKLYRIPLYHILLYSVDLWHTIVYLRPMILWHTTYSYRSIILWHILHTALEFHSPVTRFIFRSNQLDEWLWLFILTMCVLLSSRHLE